ncbi:GNAT family N-acetyltransferase [Planococcus lenghuensis]|uniref:GNAT family N-acetyltransferase n=1 Tax=Planococcus lenghuensis TaxID=2213202 RepID=A0A1Q2L209_9BACL|nr:GNAT family protein [Planococcus lenghuensis]AQQ54446.1 GNAT family N-acetyltransferase [Planococcus lenghuensis]
MIKQQEVALRLYTPEAAITYELPEEQLEFTGLPQDLIKKDAANPLRHLVIIYARGKEAGFFELDASEDRKTYTDNPNTLVLRGYSVNPELQGRGVATGSIRALPAFIRKHFPDINEVVLGVNARNTPAQRVYQRAGFEDTGRRFMGRKGEQLVMSMRVK